MPLAVSFCFLIFLKKNIECNVLQTMQNNATGTHPNCMLCKHFFITYEPARPRGCRAYGFKSSAFPSQVVLSSSGAPCQFFSPRPQK